MVFSSVIFICFFLPIAIFGTYILDNKYKNTFLLLMSLIFYSWGEPSFTVIFIISMIINYIVGLMLDRFKCKKAILVVGLFLNFSILIFYKYLSFIIRNIIFITKNDMIESFATARGLLTIALPIGISFYTFQSVSYLIDLYRGEIKVQRSLKNLMLYVSLFPQLIAGPIVRYIDVEKEIEYRHVSVNDLKKGLHRFCIGLSKKVLISNSVALYADTAFSQVQQYGKIDTGAAWLGILCYTIQIYFDFSGYSDMAIGMGHMLGFHFLENFNYPYISKSVTEFWKRWHISLSGWLKDYLYIPLGGNRKGKFRTYINLLIVFIVCGVWHGAQWTFIFWGVYQGLFLIIERVFKIADKKITIFSNVYALLVIMIGWVLFRANSMSIALKYFKQMFTLNTSGGLLGDIVSLRLTFSALIIGIIFSTPIYIIISKKFEGKKWFSFIIDIGILLLLVICIIRIVPQNYNPFIYFRF